MDNILNISFLSRAQEDFVVLQLDKTLENPFFLGPQTMLWQKQETVVYLVDLRGTKSYWQLLASQNKKSLDLFLAEKIEFCLSQQGVECFQSVFCSHPWQGLVLLKTLPLKNSQTLFFSSPLGKRYFKQLNWGQWFSALPQLLEHLGQTKGGLDREQSKIKQMQTAMRRLRIGGPSTLPPREASAIARRFGKVLGWAWQWTFFQPEEDESQDLFSYAKIFSSLQNFPWRKVDSKESPKVERNLDYSLSDWEPIEQELKKDLQKLCQSSEWTKSEKILNFCWSVHLYNLESYNLIVGFRYPHDLREEAPHFKTALMQFYYSFSQLSEELQKREEFLDLPELIPLVSWQLEISQKIILEEQELQILADGQGHNLQKIMAVENKLPLRVERYGLSASFAALGCTQSVDSVQRKESLNEWDLLHLLKQAGRYRPLYVYKEPKLLATEPTKKKFLERTSSRWWQDPAQSRLDFYKSPQQKQFTWVARDGLEQWTEYGLFS